MNFTRKLQSDWNRLQFGLRERCWGNWTLRRSPAAVSSDPAEIALYRGILEKAVAAEIREAADRVIDIGCRNWSYLPALAAAFPNAALLGVEVDARRRYWNLYRRMDLAEANALSLRKQGRDARCIFRDFRELDERALGGGGELTVFCFLFPFVSPDPCLKGGLPAPYSSFEELLVKTSDLASKTARRSVLISLHQGSWEAEIAASLYSKLNLKVEALDLDSEALSQLSPGSHFPYDLKIFVRIS